MFDYDVAIFVSSYCWEVVVAKCEVIGVAQSESREFF